MRIIVIGGYAPSLLNFRGPLLEALVARGHEVVACAPDLDDAIRAGLEAIGVRPLSIPLARAGLNPVGDFHTLLALWRLLRRERPDRVLAYTAKPVIYTHLAARLAGRPRTHAMITGLGYAFGAVERRQRLIGWLVRWLYRGALRGSSGVFFQNPDDRALFESSGLLPRQVPITLINGSGVDLDWYRPQPPSEQPVFLLIARLLADKGIREYYQAARALRRRYPRARFQLAGWMDPNPLNIQPAELRAWRDEGAIEYLGHLDDVRPAYAGCRVYVLPSYREGTPRTVLEAMAVGRAVVTTDAPGCRETVVDGVNGLLVPVGDAGGLAAAMERFIVDPPLAVAMGQAGLRRVRDKYDVKQVNRAIMEAMDV